MSVFKDADEVYKYIGGAAVWQAIPGGAQQLAGGGPNELWAHQ